MSDNSWSCITPLQISKALNYHFTHIGTRLADNIPKTSVCIEDCITPEGPGFMLSVVHRLVSSLRVDKATGLDGISARLLKEVVLKSCLLSPIQLGFLNRCGYFPDEWKISTVAYLYARRILSRIVRSIDLYLFYQLTVK